MFPSETRFIVVDDFATMRKIIKKVLLQLGYTYIKEADDGTTALTMIKDAAESGQPFGFIVSDWNMPGMRGIELLKHCKADPDLHHTPFVLVTAESEKAEVREATEFGASECIIKPFNSATLKDKLDQVYKKHYPTPKVA